MEKGWKKHTVRLGSPWMAAYSSQLFAQPTSMYVVRGWLLTARRLVQVWTGSGALTTCSVGAARWPRCDSRTTTARLQQLDRSSFSRVSVAFLRGGLGSDGGDGQAGRPAPTSRERIAKAT